ncbi:MAG TPA: zinc ribbon domain-containing protein [Thermoplasmata archaeon]|nr:zinc ribbon domain-containing protein [Thermoplasmata archaeon]
MLDRRWGPPPDEVTRPDQIAKGARDALSLLDDEPILRCWSTNDGFLVLTTLRCVGVAHTRPELFAPPEWRAGPSFFFYNLAPPEVAFGRFVRLTEEYEQTSGSARYLVHDPVGVCAEIDAARPAGRARWEARRAELASRRRAAASGPGSAFLPGRPPSRCGYCGNPVPAGASQCPACGAPPP